MADIELRPVTVSDADFLYHLLECRPVWANVSHETMPSWEQHLYFILDGGQHPIYKSHKYTAWYIIPDMGAIYLTNMDEIGISLLPMYHGLGIADKAIKELIRLHPRKRYLANISPRNTRSIKFFDKHGFKHVQNTYELRAE